MNHEKKLLAMFLAVSMALSLCARAVGAVILAQSVRQMERPL